VKSIVALILEVLWLKTSIPIGTIAESTIS